MNTDKITKRDWGDLICTWVIAVPIAVIFGGYAIFGLASTLATCGSSIWETLSKMKTKPHLLPYTDRTSVEFIHMMTACPQLTNAIVIEALMRAGHGQITARRMTGWFRARANEVLGARKNERALFRG